MARPLKEIDWTEVDRLCEFQCTGEEIASFLYIDYDTLNRACKRVYKISFADYYQQKKGVGKISLRRAQWQMATDQKNPTMLIWLGKNYLGQTDKIEDETVRDNNFTITITDATRQPQLTDAPLALDHGQD